MPFRAWGRGEAENAGEWQADCVGAHNHNLSSVPVLRAGNGNMHVLRSLFNGTISPDFDPVWAYDALGFGSGMGAESVPQHIWQPVILYLGRPK